METNPSIYSIVCRNCKRVAENFAIVAMRNKPKF